MTHITRIKKGVRLATSVVILLLAGCAVHHPAAITKVDDKQPQLLGEFSRGWLKYQFYQQGSNGKYHAGQKDKMRFTVRIINMADGTSPLRRLARNIDQYNVYYEYLLNETKNDLTLVYGDRVLYPVYYAFENNYNAFPFETINVGYQPIGKKIKGASAYLQYADKVFAHDTINCPLTASAY